MRECPAADTHATTLHQVAPTLLVTILATSGKKGVTGCEEGCVHIVVQRLVHDEPLHTLGQRHVLLVAGSEPHDADVLQLLASGVVHRQEDGVQPGVPVCMRAPFDTAAIVLGQVA